MTYTQTKTYDPTLDARKLRKKRGEDGLPTTIFMTKDLKRLLIIAAEADERTMSTFIRRATIDRIEKIFGEPTDLQDTV